MKVQKLLMKNKELADVVSVGFGSEAGRASLTCRCGGCETSLRPGPVSTVASSEMTNANDMAKLTRRFLATLPDLRIDTSFLSISIKSQHQLHASNKCFVHSPKCSSPTTPLPISQHPLRSVATSLV
jgi:hypothetical protein